MSLQPFAAAGSAGGPGGLSTSGAGTPLASMSLAGATSLVTVPAQAFVVFLATAGATATLTTLGTYLHAAAATPGAGVNRLGIYTAGGVLLAQTGDMTTAFQSAGLAEGALSSAVAVQAGQNYYLALLPNFTGTAVQTLGASGSALNSGLPLFGGLYPCLFSGGQASMPASFTPSGLSPGGSINFVYGR